MWEKRHTGEDANPTGALLERGEQGKQKRQMLVVGSRCFDCHEQRRKKGRTMKRMLKLGVVGAILGTSILAANAQTTNVVLGVNISLNGVVQNGDTVTKVKIGTKEVIQAIQPGA